MKWSQMRGSTGYVKQLLTYLVIFFPDPDVQFT